MNDVFDNIAWHPGFVAAASIELRNESGLKLQPEFNLSKEPLRIDLYIQNDEGSSVKNEIGRIFRKYNVIEYKNPSDSLNIDDFFKTLGYAYILKGLGKRVNEYPEDQITVSLFRDTYPRELFEYLKSNGRTIEKPFNGIYYITGNVPFPTQIIVTSELSADHVSLRVLSKHAKREDVERFIIDMKSATEPGLKLNADAVLQVSISANRELFDKLKEDTVMCKALEELMSDVIAERELAAATAAAEAAAENAKMLQAKTTAFNLKGIGMADEAIAKMIDMSVDLVKQWLEIQTV